MKLRAPLIVALAFLISVGFAALLGSLDRGACVEAGGRWITEQGRCDVPEGTTFVSVSRRVGVWLMWAAAVAVAMFGLAWARYRRRLVADIRSGAPVRYVYIDDDGSARELTPDEEVYLATEFELGDGAAPYVKLSYNYRTPDGRLRGYLARRDLPPGVPVRPADSGNS